MREFVLVLTPRHPAQIDGCQLGSADLVAIDIATSTVSVVFAFVYRNYFLARDFRKIWAYSILAKFALALLFMVPLVTDIGRKPPQCSAWYTGYDVLSAAVSVFYSEITNLLMIALCHHERTGLIYVLVADIYDVASKITSIGCDIPMRRST